MFAEYFVTIDRILPDDYDIVPIFYSESTNSFTDEGGYEVPNILNIITPIDLYMFKKMRRNFYKIDNQDKIWYEIIHPDDEEEYCDD